jgi:hypothetical protein
MAVMVAEVVLPGPLTVPRRVRTSPKAVGVQVGVVGEAEALERIVM